MPRFQRQYRQAYEWLQSFLFLFREHFHPILQDAPLQPLVDDASVSSSRAQQGVVGPASVSVKSGLRINIIHAALPAGLVVGQKPADKIFPFQDDHQVQTTDYLLGHSTSSGPYNLPYRFWLETMNISRSESFGKKYKQKIGDVGIGIKKFGGIKKI